MKYRTLAGTDLALSEIGFGVWSVTTSWWGEITEEHAISVLQKALDLGVTFFDTGDIYGAGYGEEIMPKALGAHRDEIVIGTKFGYDLDTPRPDGRHRERPQVWDPVFLQTACEASLGRLDTDRIDFYQLHNPRLTALQRDDTFAALESLVQQGKVRYYGAAIGPDIGWREEGEFAIRERGIPSQIIYNVLEQDPALDFIAAANDENVGLISRVPHASGTLDGTYQKGFKFDESDHRSFRRQQWLDKSLAKVDQLEFLLGGKEATIAQIALKYVLTPGIIASVLVTATTAEQLEEYCTTSDQPELPRSELDRVDILYADNFGMGAKDALKSSVA